MQTAKQSHAASNDVFIGRIMLTSNQRLFSWLLGEIKVKLHFIAKVITKIEIEDRITPLPAPCTDKTAREQLETGKTP